MDSIFRGIYRVNGKMKNGQILPASALGLSTQGNFTETCGRSKRAVGIMAHESTLRDLQAFVLPLDT